jgi:hypothetical protein
VCGANARGFGSAALMRRPDAAIKGIAGLP